MSVCVYVFVKIRRLRIILFHLDSPRWVLMYIKLAYVYVYLWPLKLEMCIFIAERMKERIIHCVLM